MQVDPWHDFPFRTGSETETEIIAPAIDLAAVGVERHAPAVERVG